MKKLENFKNQELKDLNGIWGGVPCNKYTQKIDYCKDANGNCVVDETCWECDDTPPTSSK